MFWCRDIGLAKRLLGYSVWLLGSGLAASNHDTPKASCQYEWYKPTPTPLWHSEWKIFLCEFWLLRCSTMVARAWPVSVEVIQDWLLAAPSQTSPPSCFYDTSILRYPFDLFNGSLWDVLLRCSKWLLGAWLDSFTMILRCWLVVWVKWARPLVSMIQSYVQLKSGFYGVGRPISWAVLHHRKSMGQLWDAPAPQGCNFYPILRYGLTEPASLFKCGKFHISVKSTLWATRRQSFSQC